MQENTHTKSTRRRGSRFVVAISPVHPSADWQEESGEFHIEPGVHALYFTYRGSGSMDWQWFEFC